MKATFESVQIALNAQYPLLRIDGIYCSITGFQIGTSDEIGNVLDWLIESNPDADSEELADDIALRIFASMRPSLRWNKMRAESLNDLRKAQPGQTLAYLLNRAFTPISGGNPIALAYDRIRVGHVCNSSVARQTDESLMLMLLEIDAKQGLNAVYPTFRVDDFVSPDIDAFMQMLSAWHESVTAEHDRFLKRQEMETRWWRSGNALAKPAFFSAWIESKPPTQSAIKAAEKKAESDFFADLFNEVLGKPTLAGVEQQPFVPTPKPAVPSTKMPSLFAKKGV
jgi:hypothetical protein